MELLAVEHEPSQLAVKSVREFNLKFRGERPQVLLSRFAEVAFTSVVLVAPQGCVFRAIKKYPAFDDALGLYTSSSLIPDESFYEKFINEFRKFGIASDFIPRGLFSPYDRFGGYGPKGRRPPVGRKSAYGLGLAGRAESAFVPSGCVSDIVEYWAEQLKQFQELSFLRLDPATDGLTSNPAVGIDGATSLHLNSRAGDFLALCVNTFVNPEEETQAMLRLRELEVEFRTNGPGNLNLLPGDYLKAAPSLWLGKSPLAAERLVLRASILKHAKWLWNYSKVLAGIDDLEDRLDAIAIEEKPSIKTALGDLREFIDLVNSSYPVVRENPIEGCIGF
jgi:hypothetical protein